MTSNEELISSVAALDERARRLAASIEVGYRETISTAELVGNVFSDQPTGALAIRLLLSAQSQLLEAYEALQEAHNRSDAFMARRRL